MRPFEDDLQRCLDEDLNDEEMRKLFAHLADNAELRKDFRALLALKSEFHRIQDDRSVGAAAPPKSVVLPAEGFLRRRLSISVPALAAVLLVCAVSVYSLLQNITERSAEPRYVYVMEMPAYVVQSSYTQIKSN